LKSRRDEEKKRIDPVWIRIEREKERREDAG
jgi:hypothetical protein